MMVLLVVGMMGRDEAAVQLLFGCTRAGITSISMRRI